MGWLPLIFDRLKMNKHDTFNIMQKKSLFTRSLFSYVRKSNKKDNQNIANNIAQKPKYNDIKNRELFNRSIIVGGLESLKDDNMEFLVKQTREEDRKI
jgi:hypothetical protein